MDDPQQPEDENRLIAERRAKLAALRDAGPVFPNDFRRTALADDLQRDFESRTRPSSRKQITGSQWPVG